MYEKDFTKEEMKTFRKTLNTIIEDLESLWNIGAVKKIEIPVELDGIPESYEGFKSYGWYFVMDEDGYRLENDRQEEYILLYEKGKYKRKKHLNIFPVDLSFIENYEKIRSDIVSEIQKSIKEKNIYIESANKILTRFDSQATVEIELPNTNNEHRIEVSDETGENIGILKFGNLCLRIISSAKIEFKTPEQGKAKIK